MWNKYYARTNPKGPESVDHDFVKQLQGTPGMELKVLPPGDQVKHIVCLLLGEIGDALVCTPSLNALRRQYPHAHLELIARPVVVSMLEPGRLVDSFLVFDAKDHFARLAFLWRLRFHPCDLWVDLQAPTFNTFGTDARVSRRNTWLRRIARSRFQRVFAVNHCWAKISHPVQVPSREALEQENIVDTTLRLVSEVPSVEHGRSKQLIVSGHAKAWASDWWSEKQLASTTVLGLFFGAKQPAKFWPLEQVHSLIVNWLNHHKKHSVVVFGGIHEDLLTQALLQRLSTQHSSRVKSAVGTCSLTQTAALMQRCHVMVCTDSGPMHMADALQLPMVALMSHHNHQGIWAPISSNVTVIAKQVACGPCFKVVCDKGNACMDMISAEEVLKEVFTQLKAKAI